MKKLLFVPAALLILFVSSCGKGRQASVENIKDLELRLENEKNPLKKGPLVYGLEVLCNDFAQRFPDDSLAPEFLYKAFDENLKLGWYERAVKSADLLISTYPKYEKTPEALFQKAFIYDDKLNDDVKAGDTYREFLKKYPDHALSADAENSIRFLGKTTEETLKLLEEMNKQVDSVTVRNP